MPIEFTARTDDLRRAAGQLQVNRDYYKHTDVADLVVSESAVELKAVGTEITIAAVGKRPGSARLPLQVLVNVVDVAETYEVCESTILIDNGYAKVGRTRTSHPDITVGRTGLTVSSIPSDASVLDMLAVASMMTSQQIAEAGLRQRVIDAWRAKSEVVQAAADVLTIFNVTAGEITELVDRKVEEASDVIRRVAKE